MTLPLRYRFPIAMGLSALIISPFLVRGADSEIRMASNDRGARPVRVENAAERARPTAVEPREAFDPQWGQVSGQMVNLRSGAGTQHAIVATLRSGDYLHAVAKIGNWIEVDWPESAAAWVAQDFVDAEGKVTGNNVRIRAAGNLNSAVLGEVHKGDILTVLGTSGNWYKVKAPSGAKAYIYGRYLLMGVRAPAHAAEPQPAPAIEPAPAAPNELEEPAQPAKDHVAEATAKPAEPITSKTPETPAEPAATEQPDRIAADAVALAAPSLPAMDIVEAPGIRMPSAEEARATEHNAPPILDLIAQETSQMPLVPPVVVEPMIVDTPTAPAKPEPAEEPSAPKAPEEHTAAPLAPETPAAPAKPVQAAEAPAPKEPAAPVPQAHPAEAAATRTVLPVKPPEEELWGDELPPPKRVTLPPGTRRTTGDETSEATPPAPAEREGGLVMGLLRDLSERPEAFDVAPVAADIVELPAEPNAAAPEPLQPAPEPPAQPFAWKPRAVRTPYLPLPAAPAPEAVRLPAAPRSQIGPVQARAIASVEGTLEALEGPVFDCAWAVRADDGRLWHLVTPPSFDAGALLGARVRADGRLGGYPNTNGAKVMEVSTLVAAR